MEIDWELSAESCLDAINRKNLSALRAMFHPECVHTQPNDQQISGLDHVIHFWNQRFKSHPDLRFEKNEFYLLPDTAFLLAYLSADSAYFPITIKMRFQEDKIVSWQEFSPQLPENSKINPMPEADNRVTGLGGVFFRSPDPQKLIAWYDEHLGTTFGSETYQVFRWRPREQPEAIGSTTFSIFPQTTNYFAPSNASFMLNFRVNDLEAFLEKLQNSGIPTVGKPEAFEYGKFAWILDPDGNKIELWEPGDETLFD